MKKIHRVLDCRRPALMALGLMTTAWPLPGTDSAPTIDPGKASLSVYKYDITKASNYGAWM